MACGLWCVGGLTLKLRTDKKIIGIQNYGSCNLKIDSSATFCFFMYPMS